MRFERKSYFGNRLYYCSLAEAVEQSLDGADNGSGELETLRRTVDNLTRVVGILAEACADHGVKLPLEDIVSYEYTQVEDE